MLHITGDGRPSCRPSRREWLTLGALAPLGLALPRLLAATARRPARSCLLIFMEGGPSHIDLWDMKPGAPAEVRGEFKPIATSVPGVRVCEHLPRIARQMHHVAQLRGVRHTETVHDPAVYQMLTGRKHT